MANSFVRYTGNASTTAFAISFSYRAATDLTVTVSGTATTAFTLNAAGTTLTFNTAPANASAIEIRRKTSQTARLTDYADGSVLTENDLDTDSEQAFFMSQEAIDDASDVISLDNSDFQYNVGNKRLKNISNPTAAQDAVTKNYLENTFLTSANKTALTTVNANISNINAVNSNASNINAVAGDASDIGTVASNIGSVTTVASDISKVIAVANDLAEAVSEIETVADDLNEASSEIEVVGANIANVNTVGGISANVTSVANIAANVTSVAGVASNVTAVAGISGDVTAVANIASDVAAVENIKANITTVAGVSSDVTAVANISSDVAAVENIAANVTTVAGNNSNISTVAGANSNITAVAGAITNVNNVGGAITNVNNVGGAITNLNTVASNIAGVNSFADRYRVQSGVPTSSLNVGDLNFDTNANELKVYKSSGWAAAGSTVNGTSARFTYTATANQTTFTGADLNGSTLAYDASFIDCYLNGVKLINGTDVTVTSGTSVVLATGATVGDTLDLVGFGTFNVASIAGTAITSGTINDTRLPTTMAGKTLTTATVTGTINANTLTALGDGSSADGKITLNCSQNSHGVKIQSPAHSAGQSYTLVLPTNVGTANQVLATNGNATNQLSWIDATETKPTVANVSQTIAPSTATAVTITGSNFTAIPIVEFINPTTGVQTSANTVSVTNATTLAVNVTLASGTYKVRIENPDGNAGISTNAIFTASTAPSFSTNAGSLGTFAGNFSGTLFTIAGSSDSAVTFTETTSVLSGAGVTLSSAGALTTSDFGGSSTTATTYTFTVRITDQESQTTTRQFSITSSFGATGGGQFN